MPLSKEQWEKVENIIKDNLRKKFTTYKPETNSMPFHYRLLGKDRMALVFFHSFFEYNLWDFHF